MHDESLQQHAKIACEMLESRIVTVKELQTGELEMYEVAKDNETGEHYLHYAYMHRNLADTGVPETFHHFMPIDSDDVLGLIFGEQPYAYPDHWHKPFLRNGPEGFYIWFDPSYGEDNQTDEAIAAELLLKLRQFRELGHVDPESVSKLLEDLDDTRKKKE